MRKRNTVSPVVLGHAIERAKRLVKDCCSPAMPPSERLLHIAKKLKVVRIEAGAAAEDSDGFLADQGEGTFAIYYNGKHMPERRRFTVAHELAHLVLDKFHKHLNTKKSQSLLAGRGYRARRFQQATRHTRELENAVNRIAAELLMPAQLVTPLLIVNCRAERESSPAGLIDKHRVLSNVRTALGVSESALIMRLQELPDILGLRFELQWAETGLFDNSVNTLHALQVSTSPQLRIESYSIPSRSELNGPDGWRLPVHIRLSSGEKRTIRCQAWRRSPIVIAHRKIQVTWIVGWTWRDSPIPDWDDAER